MLLEHRGERPQIHETAYVAPTATVCGDVTIGEESCVLFGAVITSEGGPVYVGDRCIVMEQAVLRGTPRHPLDVGDDALVGPRAYLSGCTVGAASFLATGSTVFNGATVGTGTEVRVNGTVHVGTTLPEGSTVPIGWVAVGDPVEVLPPGDHDRIWACQEPMDFPGTVFGLDREPTATLMPKVAARYVRSLRRHDDDVEL